MHGSLASLLGWVSNGLIFHLLLFLKAVDRSAIRPYKPAQSMQQRLEAVALHNISHAKRHDKRVKPGHVTLLITNPQHRLSRGPDSVKNVSLSEFEGILRPLIRTSFLVCSPL